MARTKAFDQTEVLKKIQKLFWDRGFNGTSVDDLVQASGLSRSSLYDTFGDKEALFNAVLKLYRQESTQQLLDLIERSTDIKKTVGEIFEVVRTTSQCKERMGCLMVNTAIELAPHEKKVSKLVEESMEATQLSLVKAIKKAQTKGNVSKKYSAEGLAILTLTSINGLRVAEKWGTDESTYKQVKEVVLSMY